MNILFLKFSLIISIFISLLFFEKIYGKHKYFILGAFLLSIILFLISFNNFQVFIIKILILLFFTLFFLIRMFMEDRPYVFKVSFIATSFYLIYTIVFLIEFLLVKHTYRFYILETIPFLLILLFYKEIVNKDRMKITLFIFNFIISIVMFFPIMLFTIQLFFKDFTFVNFEDIVFFSFITAVLFTSIIGLMRPVFNYISPIYLNIDRSLVKYLTHLMELNNKKGSLEYTNDFIVKIFPLVSFTIKEKNSVVEFKMVEKKGRPLFLEEFNFINIVKKQLNSKLNNIYYMDELQNKLEEIERLEQQLGEIKVFSIMGQMIATVSHQLRNPLAVLKSSVELMSNETMSIDERNEILKSMTEEINRLQTILEKFLNLARKKEIKKENINVNKLIKNILVELKTDNALYKIRGEESISTSKEMLKELLKIIIQNGLDAISNVEKGQVHIEIIKGKITIKDNGTPIHGNKNKIFEPFFTTKAKGIGLGLTIAKRLSETMGLQLNYKKYGVWKKFIIKWS
ncbi:HAMP domain-containing histidine kinase [bacterium]|nr:HAMP domain-containing histidine kinase [bacterium]